MSRFSGARGVKREHVVTLPDDGKVTGVVTVYYTSPDHASVRTDAHINDDLPAINYRGESFLVHVHVYKLPDGTFETRHAPHVTRRCNWSDAPPSFAKAIEAAVVDATAANWDATLAGNGGAFYDRIERDRLNADIGDLSEQLKAKRAALRKVENRLQAWAAADDSDD